MTNEEFCAGMDAIVAAVQLLSVVDLETMDRTCLRAESIGPIIMPTAFNEGMNRLTANRDVIHAARRFLAAAAAAART
jgi:hypothetical protein